MPAYTSVLQKPLETIFWEDDNFMEELLQVVRLFRPFSAAITEFISEHGYQGDTSDIDAKVAFIRAAFAKADMDAPREVREWFSLLCSSPSSGTQFFKSALPLAWTVVKRMSSSAAFLPASAVSIAIRCRKPYITFA